MFRVDGGGGATARTGLFNFQLVPGGSQWPSTDTEYYYDTLAGYYGRAIPVYRMTPVSVRDTNITMLYTVWRASNLNTVTVLASPLGHWALAAWVCSYYIQVEISLVVSFVYSIRGCCTIICLNLISSGRITPLLRPALGAKLGRHTTGIRITWGINTKSWKTFGGFLEGFFVIKGQTHWDQHHDYCWYDALVNVISKTREVDMNRSYNHIKHLLDNNDIFKNTRV